MVVIECAVCESIGRVATKNGLPSGWRRVTISNPASLKKRGVTGIICKPQCASKFLLQNWNGAQLTPAAA